MSPKAVGYQFLPDFHISGLLYTLEKITEYEVNTIVFAHNGNYLDPLETGNKETVRFAIQYYKVRFKLKFQNPLIVLLPGPSRRRERGDEKGNSLLPAP